MENFYLLSYHGFFLEYDSDIGIYEQSIISSTKKISKFFLFNVEKDKSVLSFFEKLNIKLNDNFISIHDGNFYLTSLPDGTLIKQEVKSAGAWELFLKIPEEFFHKFYKIVNKNWLNSGEIIKKRDIYISDNYTVNLGSYRMGIYEFINGFKYDFSNPSQFSFSVNGCNIECIEVLDSEINKIIWVESLGNIANRALQYLVAKSIEERTSNLSIRNVNLPEWGMQKEHCELELENSCIIGELDFWFDIRGLSQNLNVGNIDSFKIKGYPFNVDFYPSRKNAKIYLPNFSDFDEQIVGFSEDQIVFNIRADEILHGIHADYLVLPFEYYKMLAFKTGLKPVFFGQLASNPYIEKLKEEFPDASFVNGRGAHYDFEVLRRSCNIAISVSTFSWLAAWLSDAKNIYVPLAGMMNPCQAVGQNFIPRNDPAYKFISFPLCRSECLYRHPERFWESLSYMARNMKFISAEDAYNIFQRVDTLRNTKQGLGGFDPRFYIKKNYKDALTPGNALDHYMRNNAKIQNAFPLKERDYLIDYPEAGIMTANGYFSSVNEYHSFIGTHIGNKCY